MAIDEKLLKPYDHKGIEDAIYKKWEESGFFNPDNLPPQLDAQGKLKERTDAFSIVLPPPNVTGVLHMGSALMLVIEDIMVRFERMRGKNTLWLPGTDSAAIATQTKVEKEIKKTEGKNRHELGREELLRRIDVFIEENKSTILKQIRKMGASVDWSRYAYTMDEKRNKAVIAAFVRMYNAGLIYRGNRIVNWDPKGQTTISDDEIVYVEEKTKFYYLKYGPFIIGTARPETKFGDKYVVMHPQDKRYSHYAHGQKIELEWINGPITATIIKDDAVDKEFGTGVMTITPWHSAIDFEIAERHGLEKEQIIDEFGKLLPIAGDFAGMKIAEAREKIIEKLKSKGLLVKEEHYTHNIATAERTGGIIEPHIKLQWFIDVEKEFTIPLSKIPGIPSGSKTTLKKIMQQSVESGAIKILEKRFEKTYFHWIDHLRPWCISRQIWFGHRIPVWYRSEVKSQRSKVKGIEDQEVYVGMEPPAGDGWHQDEDVLDTWFSSALWTFSTLGWPTFAETATAGKPGPENDLANYHPTSVLETGYDILFFWVARMILMSGFFLGEVPFKTVYLHGLVRDEQGRKISKSLGNNIDPIDMGEKFGTDAVRMALVIGMAPGTDSKISESKIRGYKHFANKLWNISRFVLQNSEGFQGDVKPSLPARDQAIISEFEDIAKKITNHMNEYEYHLAGEILYHYLWHTFADIIIEESKPILQSTDEEEKRARQWTLLYILENSLMLLHPFMPFITEELWGTIPPSPSLSKKNNNLLLIQSWPK